METKKQIFSIASNHLEFKKKHEKIFKNTQLHYFILLIEINPDVKIKKSTCILQRKTNENICLSGSHVQVKNHHPKRKPIDMKRIQ